MDGTWSVAEDWGCTADSLTAECLTVFRRYLPGVLLVTALVASPALAADPPVVVSALRPDVPSVARGLPLGAAMHLDGVKLVGRGFETLELERFPVFAAGATIKINGAGASASNPAPDNAYYRGTVAGIPGSRAVMTFRAAGGVRGVVTSPQGHWIIDAQANQTGVPLGFTSARGDVQTKPSFACADAPEPPPIDAPAPPAGGPTGGAPPRSGTFTHSARIAMDTDYEFFALFGNAVDAADYAADVVAFSSATYEAELETSLTISSLQLWADGPNTDPWTATSCNASLDELRSYWNSNNSAVGRSVVHMLTGKNIGCGIAYVGVLCNASYGYGLTGNISGNFDINNPAVIWDVVAFAHEIGHNFDSPHTHCYNGIGQPEAVDGCYNQANGCYAGTAGLPAGCPGAGSGCGTIMSYCHLLSGGMSNISFSFGLDHPYGTAPERVPSRMRDHVLERAPLFPGCLDSVCAPTNGGVEICDDIDNNCDGTVDEGVLNACGGCATLPANPGDSCGDCGTVACAGEDATTCDDPGFNVCGACGAVPEEVCNDGADNDCDGDTDGADSDCASAQCGPENVPPPHPASPAPQIAGFGVAPIAPGSSTMFANGQCYNFYGSSFAMTVDWADGVCDGVLTSGGFSMVHTYTAPLYRREVVARCCDGSATPRCTELTRTIFPNEPPPPSGPDCSHLDDACHQGVYDTSLEACVAADRPNGTACNDGVSCTANDICTAGACAGTEPDADNDGYGACTDCDDSNPNRSPGLSEQCTDGIDNDCDEDVDLGDEDCCSTLDTACLVGEYDQSAEQCVVANRPDGTSCDDALACTGQDICTAGVCAGTELDQDNDSSGACSDCDDNDPNRAPHLPEICTDQVDNDCDDDVDIDDVDCHPDCSGLDAACVVGVFDVPSETCVTEPRPNGTSCNDGLACTGQDACQAGVCGGTEIDGDGDGVGACTDCDDSDPTSAPGFAEVCGDGNDNDCDGAVDAADDDCAAAEGEFTLRVWVQGLLRSGGSALPTVISVRLVNSANTAQVVDIANVPLSSAGEATVSFEGQAGASYWVVVDQLNHLTIQSAAPVAIASAGTVVDLKQTAGVLGSDALICSGGRCAMRAGDIDGDGSVDVADYIALLGSWNGSNAAADLDADGVVGSADYILWIGSYGKNTYAVY